MTNQQQVDLLKQESATLWNTWREKHHNTAIELNGIVNLMSERKGFSKKNDERKGRGGRSQG